MVENIFRELAARHGRGLQPDRRDPRGGARRGAAHLLRHRGDHRRLSSHLRADRALGTAVPADGGHHVVRAARLAALRADAAAGAVLLFAAQARCTSRGARLYRADPRAATARCWAGACATARSRWCVLLAIFAASLLLIPLIGARVHAAPGRRRAVGARHHSLHHLLRRGLQALAADPRYPAELSAGDHGGQRTGPARRRHRSHRLLQQRILHRPEALRRSGLAGLDPHQAAADRGDSDRSCRRFPASSSTTRSPPRTPWTRPKPA